MREAAGTQSTAQEGVDARTLSPGAPPTDAADVDMDSEVPRLEATDDSSSDEIVSDGLPVDPVPEKDEPPKLVLSD